MSFKPFLRTFIIVRSNNQKSVRADFFGKYVSALADANLKVGYSNSNAEDDEGIMDMYDLAIQGNEPLDFKDYIEQIVKYLNMIQK